MERLIHAVESFPTKLYVDALARELLPLTYRASVWTSILHIRIVQSRRHLCAYVGVLVGAGPEMRSALGALMTEVATSRPDLARIAAAGRRAVTRRELLRE
jgi:hypothetical protein